MKKSLDDVQQRFSLSKTSSKSFYFGFGSDFEVGKPEQTTGLRSPWSKQHCFNFFKTCSHLSGLNAFSNRKKKKKNAEVSSRLSGHKTSYYRDMFATHKQNFGRIHFSEWFLLSSWTISFASNWRRKNDRSFVRSQRFFNDFSLISWSQNRCLCLKRTLRYSLSSSRIFVHHQVSQQFFK